MRALLDTNIIIHRETGRIVNRDIGILFKWLDKGKYTKCIHPITVEEITKNSNQETVKSFSVKLESYETLKTVAPLADKVKSAATGIDFTVNDSNDTILLNEVYCDRVDLLITEDKKIHKKAFLLGISDRIFTIDSFLEKVVSENPELVDYKVLSVTKKHFGNINISDTFFESFKEDYVGFEKWFNKKSDEIAYVTYNNSNILSFLYLKVEGKEENYSDINPVFKPKKRLKIGTFKVVNNGVRLGERFLKIVFDNAMQNKVEEIYVTIFDKRDEQKRLISLMEEWGFVLHGKKVSTTGEELVYVRDLKSSFNISNPKLTYPYISKKAKVFLVPIYPDYHTELLPDSILKTESPDNFIENEPHRNAISKVYISRSIERSIDKGDILVFYRTAEKGKNAYFSAVITTIAIAEGKIDKIANESDFILKCRKRSVFTDDELKKYWNYNEKYRPFIINFLYVCSFLVGKRMNRKKLLDLGIISGSENELRGLKQISIDQFDLIIKETQTNESIIVN
jgi:predicted nucleic acid-binding protein